MRKLESEEQLSDHCIASVSNIWSMFFKHVRSALDGCVCRPNGQIQSSDTAEGNKFQESGMYYRQSARYWGSWAEGVLMTKNIAIVLVISLFWIPYVTYQILESCPEYQIPLRYTHLHFWEQTKLKIMKLYIRNVISKVWQLASLVNLLFKKAFYQYLIFVVLRIWN